MAADCICTLMEIQCRYSIYFLRRNITTCFDIRFNLSYITVAYFSNQGRCPKSYPKIRHPLPVSDIMPCLFPRLCIIGYFIMLITCLCKNLLSLFINLILCLFRWQMLCRLSGFPEHCLEFVFFIKWCSLFDNQGIG